MWGIPDQDFWAFVGAILGSLLIIFLLLWHVKGDEEWQELKR